MDSRKPVRVLIAEDEFLVSKEIARTIKDIGHKHIGTAIDGEQAVEMTMSLQPDVVIMDIEMPKMDGLKAAHKIQSQCPTPIVILTAHESRDLYDRASEAGVGVYLTKPPVAEELARAIILVIARHEDLMTARRLYAQLAMKTKELEKANEEIKVLRGIIPICMKCNKVRDENGHWHEFKKYVLDHSHTRFSHTLCTECFEKEMKKNMG